MSSECCGIKCGSACGSCAPYARDAVSSTVPYIAVGTHTLDVPALVDYVSDKGTYNGSSYTGIVSSYDMVSDDAVSDGMDMTWECVPDDTYEEQEVSLPMSQFLSLYAKAQAYDKGPGTEAGCTCSRGTDR